MGAIFGGEDDSCRKWFSGIEVMDENLDQRVCRVLAGRFTKFNELACLDECGQRKEMS